MYGVESSGSHRADGGMRLASVLRSADPPGKAPRTLPKGGALHGLGSRRTHTASRIRCAEIVRGVVAAGRPGSAGSSARRHQFATTGQD